MRAAGVDLSSKPCEVVQLVDPVRRSSAGRDAEPAERAGDDHRPTAEFRGDVLGGSLPLGVLPAKPCPVDVVMFPDAVLAQVPAQCRLVTPDLPGEIIEGAAGAQVLLTEPRRVVQLPVHGRHGSIMPRLRSFCRQLRPALGGGNNTKGIIMYVNQ